VRLGRRVAALIPIAMAAALAVAPMSVLAQHNSLNYELRLDRGPDDQQPSPVVIYSHRGPGTVYGLPVPAFVRRSGSQLLLDGKPYHFTGLNIYNVTNAGSCWYDFSAIADIEKAMAATSAPVVIRSWFFQRLATTSGQRDWTSFDRTVALARAHGQRLIATLGNQWGDCEAQPPVYKTEGWYRTGYRSRVDSDLPASYRDWVAEVVTRYRNDPTIVAWQLMNEAESPVSQGGRCSYTAATTLRAFAADMARLVKSIDSNHLVSLGTHGGGQCGTAGTDYQYVHSVPEIDLCEYHDYDGPGVAIARALQVRLRQCSALGKPLFVGETGIQVSVAGSPERRAAAFQAKFVAQFGAGVVGELIWDWVDGAHPAYSGYELGPSDPALALLGRSY